MKISDSVIGSIDDFAAGKIESSVMHACFAVDGTARKLVGSNNDSRKRFVSFLRDHYWLLEPMVTPGINLVDTRWGNVPLSKQPNPDLAEIIYEVHRCSHGHGDEVPGGFKFTRSVGTKESLMEMSAGVLHLPDRLPFGLLAAAVLARVNRDQVVPDRYFLTLGEEKFTINDWWGRESDFRPIAAKYNQIRVHLQGLSGLNAGTP